MIGTTLGHYRIVERLGAGGMGVVYRARDEHLERDVALKILQPGIVTDRAARRRFRKEALALSRLNHANIDTVYEFGSEDGVDFLALEFVPGTTLSERLESGPVPPGDVAALGMQVAAALEEAHEHGVVHRDLKPSNIMLTPKGQVKVLDFGVATLLHPPTDPASALSTTEGPGLAGTLPYMAPEQLSGRNVDPRTDIHALGAVLYEMASGRRPHAGATVPLLIDAILHQPPATPRASNPSLPLSLESIILKCLEKDPENRYQSARELLVDLRRTVLGSGAAAVHEMAPAPRPAPRRAKRLLAVALGLLVLAAAALSHLVPVRVLTEQDVILVTGLENLTRDPLFDGTLLRDALVLKLMESPYLNLYAPEDVRHTLQLMARPADSPVDEQTAREICIRGGVTAMVAGSIAPLGQHYIIQLKAVVPGSGATLAIQQVEAGSKEEVVRQLGNAAAELRRKLGESLPSLRQFNVPLEQATTTSLEALQAFSAGTQMSDRARFAEARAFFLRAIEIDPRFALAYANLALMYGNDNQAGPMRAAATKAYELRSRASERERLAIEFRYHASVTEDIRRAVDVAELLAQAYPRDWSAHRNLGLYYRTLGRYEEAIEQFQAVARLSPRRAGIADINLAWTYLFLNRLDEAEEHCDRALVSEYDSVGARQLKYLLAAIHADGPGMAQQVQALAGKPQEYLTARWQGDAAAFAGRMEEAGRFFDTAARLAEHRHLRDRMAIEEAWAAFVEALVGSCNRVPERLDRALSLSRETSVLRDAANALAECGRVERAETLAAELARSRPQSTYVQEILLPNVRALVEIKRRNYRQAIDVLQPLLRNDRTASGMRSDYLRGVAFQGLGDGAAAGAEFQKILDNRRLDPLSVLFPLAHLALGRAARLAGDPARSRTACQGFFALWEDADPDVPVLTGARTDCEGMGSRR